MPHVRPLLAALTLSAASLAAVAAIAAQQSAVEPSSRTAALFTESTNIGIAQPGSVVFDPSTHSYKLSGGGADMWGNADDFFFAWRRHSGDGSLVAEIRFPPGTHPPNEKAVLMFRQSLDPGSPYADVAIHADGHITLQWRGSAGAFTQDLTAPGSTFSPIGIARRGDHFSAFVSQHSGTTMGAWHDFASVDLALKDPVYVGLGVCAHDAAGLATVTFTGVHISGTADVTP